VHFFSGVPEYERIGLIRSRELGDLLARKLGSGLAVMMRGHGITTALARARGHRRGVHAGGERGSCSCACSHPRAGTRRASASTAARKPRA